MIMLKKNGNVYGNHSNFHAFTYIAKHQPGSRFPAYKKAIRSIHNMRRELTQNYDHC